MKHNFNADGLRGIAAINVLMTHYDVY